MIIVTGGAGLIGANMIWELNRQGVDDILVVDNLASTEKWKNLSHLRYSNYMHRDRFLEELRSGKKLEGVECVIHMGACSSTTERNADFLMEKYDAKPVEEVEERLMDILWDNYAFQEDTKISYQT